MIYGPVKPCRTFSDIIVITYIMLADDTIHLNTTSETLASKAGDFVRGI